MKQDWVSIYFNDAPFDRKNRMHRDPPMNVWNGHDTRHPEEVIEVSGCQAIKKGPQRCVCSSVCLVTCNPGALNSRLLFADFLDELFDDELDEELEEEEEDDVLATSDSSLPVLAVAGSGSKSDTSMSESGTSKSDTSEQGCGETGASSSDWDWAGLCSSAGL